MDDLLRSILRRLYECNAIKFGNFKLKTGTMSPVYIDLRIVISYPNLLIDMCNELDRLARKCNFDIICGVPYTGLTMATCLSTQHNHPMVMRRKEAKSYGTKQVLEGIYHDGQQVLIVEDVISSGTSILETVAVLKQVDVNITDVIVFIDREQGGVENMAQHGIKVHSVLTVSQLLLFLAEEGHLTQSQAIDSIDWIHKTKLEISCVTNNQLDLVSPRKNISFSERAKLSKHPLTKALFKLMERKESNLCVSADLVRTKDILKLAQIVGPHIVMLKTHVDIIEDFNMEFVDKLRYYSKQFNFLLFEDRKFADIGSTVGSQYSKGLYRINDWAHFVNAHLAPGSGLIKALKEEASKAMEPRACLLIAQMSSEGNLLPASYSDEAFKLANSNADYVVGFISQSRITSDPTLIHFTPGVRIAATGDDLGQQYVTPELAVSKHCADIIIVGRGIISELESVENLLSVTKEYQKRGYDAYLQTL